MFHNSHGSLPGGVICKGKREMNHNLKNRLPKPQDTDRLLNILKAKNLNSTEYEELVKEINGYFKIIPLKYCIIKKGAMLYRARKNKNEKPYEEVSKIYIAPKNRIDDFGRANKPRQQIFYTGLDMKQAAFEVLQDHKNSTNPYKEHDSVTIGAYEVLEEINLATLIFSPDVQKVRPEMKQHIEEEKEMLDFSVLGEDFVNSSNLILEFFSDKFAEPNLASKEYMYSVFYINHVLFANELIDPKHNFQFEGVNYPSVARKYKFDNQALTLETAEKKLKLKNIYNVICTGFDFDTGDLTIGILHDANSWKDGKIIWNTNQYGYSK